MVRETVVRVLDFAQSENLKRGQENRGRVLETEPPHACSMYEE